ncbi:MAG TPA: tetratricopeptide repeat protein, partial [Caldimonas sp.]|nr:tetratricopeptide repeat protein [Caldimonas sp.]
AQVLQVKEEAPAQSLQDALCGALRTRDTLLVLDNCEHVLDGCARLIAALLRETTGVTVIATSREPLHLPGERVHPLDPLPLPDPKADAGTIARADAVRLFVERARQQRPGFELQDKQARAVAEICLRLDGIPLAVELAAARVAVLPVEQIVRLLAQRFRLLTGGSRELPRHQTLHAMIDWSYELLDDAEKALFARLAVFAGGWTLEAASDVCSGESIAKDDVVYVLIGLVEQSLVVADEDGDRYRMLETVREYAEEKLTESASGDAGQERWRDRHLACFVALADEAEPNLIGAEQRSWLDRLERELDNVRSALAWATRADAVRGMRLASALQRFWQMRGTASEGLAWLTATLAAAPTAPTAQRAKALSTAATMARASADFAKARALYGEALSLWRELGDRRGIAAALSNLGMVSSDQGDFAESTARHEESLAIWRELGDRRGIARTLLALGNVVYSRGDEAAAEPLYEQSLAIERELGDQRVIAIVLNNLGMVAEYHRNDHATARRLHDEALAIRRALGDRWGIAGSLTNLGTTTFEQGDHASAHALLTESLAIRRELADRIGIVQSFEALAALAFATDRARTGARLRGQAARLREEIGAPLAPWEQLRRERQVAAGRASLGDDAAFDRAWQEGRAMTLEQAIDEALQEPGAAA